MKLIIFGLTVSSSWGNGHATLWRGLWRALARRGHQIVFFERDLPEYAAYRDLDHLPNGSLCFYTDWQESMPTFRRHLADADAAMVTSFCPDGLHASDLVLSSRAARIFYDMDTPTTLDRLRTGETVSYLPHCGLSEFDLVLSYTGGKAVDALRRQLGARRVATLYASVDPDAYRPVPPREAYRSDLSYLGAYTADRQPSLERLLIEPARRLANRRFVVGGAHYPHDFPWSANLSSLRHVAPADHPAFYCSSRLTLNVTRRAMADVGHCPSPRLFEAAACGVPVLTDPWEGIERFLRPGEEILIAQSSDEAVAAIESSDAELQRIAAAARERTLAEHTADQRAVDLERAIESISAPEDDPPSPRHEAAVVTEPV